MRPDRHPLLLHPVLTKLCGDSYDPPCSQPFDQAHDIFSPITCTCVSIRPADPLLLPPCACSALPINPIPMSSSYGVPSFGAPVNVYSPKSGYASPQTYQPLPIVASPSFGTPYGGSQTPPQHNRHTSYNKSAEPEPTSIPPSVERVRRHREYYLDGGDIIFLASLDSEQPK